MIVTLFFVEDSSILLFSLFFFDLLPLDFSGENKILYLRLCAFSLPPTKGCSMSELTRLMITGIVSGKALTRGCVRLVGRRHSLSLEVLKRSSEGQHEGMSQRAGASLNREAFQWKELGRPKCDQGSCVK